MDSYLKINKFFLSIIGQWPYQSPKDRKIFFCIGHGILGLIFIPVVSGLFEARNVSQDFIECIPPVFTAIAAYCYTINCCLNMKRMKLLTDCMEANWKSVQICTAEAEIIRRSTEKGRFLTAAYAIYAYVSTTIYLMTPMIPQFLDVIQPLNETRTKLYLYHVDYFIFDKEDYYYLVFAHGMICGFIALTNIVAVDFLFCVYVQHACGMFRVLGYRLTKTIGKSLKAGHEKQDEMVHQDIIGCIKLYNQILEFTDNIEACFSTLFLFIIGINMLMISFQGVQIVLNLDNTQIVMRFGSFFLGQISHLFYNSLPGQKLIDESTKVYQYCYESKWTDMPVKSQKLILLMMLRSLRECKVSAGKLYVMSMENFSVVIKTSFSYLSVMTSTQ